MHVHLLKQHADDLKRIAGFAVEHDVASAGEAAVAGANLVARLLEGRALLELAEAFFEKSQISALLREAPPRSTRVSVGGRARGNSRAGAAA